MDHEDKHVPIRLLESDQNLRFRGWIERNREKVDQATQGKVGYIYVTETGVTGQIDLVRQFFGQRHKEALIIDDRWNGVGKSQPASSNCSIALRPTFGPYEMVAIGFGHPILTKVPSACSSMAWQVPAAICSLPSLSR